MKKVVTARDVEEVLRRGGKLSELPPDAVYTPSAQDAIRDFEMRALREAPPRPAADAGPPAPPKRLSSSSSKADLEALFNSPYAHSVKQQICDVGRRMWEREYVDGNGGNIAVRVGEDLAICTPTLVSKGFMQPDDLCLVDFAGKQLAGSKNRTSEILMHLQIMARQPKAVATVHCHPPYATGFAVVGLEPPTCLIPEYEVFSSVALAPYRTPGTPEMGKLVADLVEQHNTILMANHGVVSWSPKSVEEAYFKMEILEAYCRTVLVTTQLGKKPNTFTPQQMQDLLKIKKSLDIPDPRYGLKEAELCDNEDWRPGVQCAVPRERSGAQGSPRASVQGGPGDERPPVDKDAAETLIQTITDRIMERLK